MVWASPHFTALFYTGNFSSRKTGNLAGLGFMVAENHQSPSRNDQNKIIKPSRKEPQKSSLAGGLANGCKNHQLHVRDDTCSEILISHARAYCLAFFYRVRKFLVSLARVTAPKTLRLASSKLTLYSEADELRPVAVAVIACLHQGINGVHSLGFDRNDKADRFSKLSRISAHKCGSLVGGVVF